MAITQARFLVISKIRVSKVKPLLFNTELLLIKIDHPAILRLHLIFQHELFKMTVYIVVLRLHLFLPLNWDTSILFLRKTLIITEKRLIIQVLLQTINRLSIVRMEITRCNSYKRSRINFLTLG